MSRPVRATSGSLKLEFAKDSFMQPLLASLQELIAQSQAALPEGLKNLDQKKAPGKKRRSGKTPKKKKAARPRRTPRKTRPRAPG